MDTTEIRARLTGDQRDIAWAEWIKEWSDGEISDETDALDEAEAFAAGWAAAMAIGRPKLLCDTLDAKDKVIAGLVGALEPFAEEAEHWCADERPGHEIVSPSIAVSDLKRARAAIRAAKE